MFEKEAEEYLKTDGTKAEQILNMLNEISPLKIKIKQLPFVLAMLQQVYQDGAEFGYNKAKIEVEESYRESLCNSELNLASVTEQLEELEKANEWHYPSKGEYPDNDSDILCQIDFETSEVGYFNEIYNNFFTIDGKELKVKAWKEIVLPELKESE